MKQLTPRIRIPFHDTFPRLPNDQNIYCCNCSASLKYDNTATTAEVTLPNIRPMIRIAMVSFILKVTDSTASSTRKLPKEEAITSPQEFNKSPPIIPPKVPAPNIRIAMPKLAPLLIPSTKGPANGLRNKVCIINPEIASPLPVNIAVIDFGSL